MSKVLNQPAAGPKSEEEAGRWVHRRVHYDQEVFDLEMARLFRRCWIYVGHESEMPNAGDYIAGTVAGEPIVVVRDKDRDLQAFFNTCTHRGVKIAAMPRQSTRNQSVRDCSTPAASQLAVMLPAVMISTATLSP